MDKTTRQVLVLLLERLRLFEKSRLEDLAALNILIEIIREAAPSADQRFKTEVGLAKDRIASGPAPHIDAGYDQLIRLLKDPATPEEERQEKLRRLLESFEGPAQ